MTQPTAKAQWRLIRHLTKDEVEPIWKAAVQEHGFTMSDVPTHAARQAARAAIDATFRARLSAAFSDYTVVSTIYRDLPAMGIGEVALSALLLQPS